MAVVVRALECAWESSVRDARRLDLLGNLRGDAAAALARGDVARAMAVLAVMARLGGPLFSFEVPSHPGDAAGWRSILDRLGATLREATQHNQAMRARLARHLADPQPWNPAWRHSVARTAILQERHVRRWRTTVALLKASQDAMAP